MARKLKIKVFKMKNRRGFAALCCDHLTERGTPIQARERMKKALKRKKRKR